jgi:hypothetical protein
LDAAEWPFFPETRVETDGVTLAVCHPSTSRALVSVRHAIYGARAGECTDLNVTDKISRVKHNDRVARRMLNGQLGSLHFFSPLPDCCLLLSSYSNTRAGVYTPLQVQSIATHTYPIPLAIAMDNSAHRSFSRSLGDEIRTSTVVNMSLLSVESKLSGESKDTALTSVATDDLASVISGSECGTEISSVALLRGWLDDFGKLQKKHYSKTAVVGKAPADVELEKPIRPKVRAPALSMPTPLPKSAASALAKRMAPQTTKSITGSTKSTAGSTKSSIADTTTTTVTTLRKHTAQKTMQLKPKFEASQVQATDEGYASVAKLSAWLADDPTRPKKVKQIRRGANVIAKSLTFDKGLANVIVTQNNLKTGHVLEIKKRIFLERSKAVDDGDLGLATPSQDFASAARTSVRATDKKGGTNNTSANFVVAAVERTSCRIPKKAQTDFVTAQDDRDALTSRAKDLWRSKMRSCGPAYPNLPITASKPDIVPAVHAIPSRNALSRKEFTTVTMTKTTPRLVTLTPTPTKTTGGPTENGSNPVNGNPKPSGSPDEHAPLFESSKREEKRREPVVAEPADNKIPVDISPPVKEEEAANDEDKMAPLETDQPPVGFHDARQLLVDRSKANVPSKVQTKKAKFERLQQLNDKKRLSAHGLLKPSWRADVDKNNSGPSNSYIKKYVDDIPQKKSLAELP